MENKRKATRTNQGHSKRVRFNESEEKKPPKRPSKSEEDRNEDKSPKLPSLSYEDQFEKILDDKLENLDFYTGSDDPVANMMNTMQLTTKVIGLEQEKVILQAQIDRLLTINRECCKSKQILASELETKNNMINTLKNLTAHNADALMTMRSHLNTTVGVVNSLDGSRDEMFDKIIILEKKYEHIIKSLTTKLKSYEDIVEKESGKDVEIADLKNQFLAQKEKFEQINSVLKEEHNKYVLEFNEKMREQSKQVDYLQEIQLKLKTENAQLQDTLEKIKIETDRIRAELNDERSCYNEEKNSWTEEKKSLTEHFELQQMNYEQNFNKASKQFKLFKERDLEYKKKLENFTLRSNQTIKKLQQENSKLTDQVTSLQNDLSREREQRCENANMNDTVTLDQENDINLRHELSPSLISRNTHDTEMDFDKPIHAPIIRNRLQQLNLPILGANFNTRPNSSQNSLIFRPAESTSVTTFEVPSTSTSKY